MHKFPSRKQHSKEYLQQFWQALNWHTMLRCISDIWWPKIHREVITTAKCCDWCNLAVESVILSLEQSQFRRISKSVEPNEEIALDLAGPFQNAEHGKKYLLVAIDNFFLWSDALFLHKPTTRKVINFLKNYISQSDMLDLIRSGPGLVFTTEELKAFCRQFRKNTYNLS